MQPPPTPERASPSKVSGEMRISPLGINAKVCYEGIFIDKEAPEQKSYTYLTLNQEENSFTGKLNIHTFDTASLEGNIKGEAEGNMVKAKYAYVEAGEKATGLITIEIKGNQAVLDRVDPNNRNLDSLPQTVSRVACSA